MIALELMLVFINTILQWKYMSEVKDVPKK